MYGGFGHHWIDAEAFESGCNFFHFSGSAFAVNNDSSDHVVGELPEVETGKAFVEGVE
jgi:hypothetical protein